MPGDGRDVHGLPGVGCPDREVLHWFACALSFCPYEVSCKCSTHVLRKTSLVFRCRDCLGSGTGWTGMGRLNGSGHLKDALDESVQTQSAFGVAWCRMTAQSGSRIATCHEYL